MVSDALYLRQVQSQHNVHSGGFSSGHARSRYRCVLDPCDNFGIIMGPDATINDPDQGLINAIDDIFRSTQVGNMLCVQHIVMNIMAYLCVTDDPSERLTVWDDLQTLFLSFS